MKDDLYGDDGLEPSAEVSDDPLIAEASAYWRRGDRREALHKLENALGRDFHGLGDLKFEDLK